jgi:regulator of sigma E protease
MYELITKQAPNEKVIIIITLMGWAILLGLMFLGLYNDINRILN